MIKLLTVYVLLEEVKYEGSNLIDVYHNKLIIAEVCAKLNKNNQQTDIYYHYEEKPLL